MRSLPSLLVTSLALLPVALFGARGAAPLEPGAQQELSADFSVAKVVDREGVALARAATEERWRSADEHLALDAGTSLKTGARGANALHVKTKGGATLTLGPDALVDVTDGSTVHVRRGEVAIGASEQAPLKVGGPGGVTLDLTAKKVVRARDGKLVVLDQEPRWLTGYESGRPTEALGSLLANVDGREVPLTLGYHKVTVDVRDQIARTVIEESFVNHTDLVLEGVFYFPLPPDASISSFGMWIGDELVEGDIVEKERARAIFEQILREKRDPGLLEWAGGNVFKARVYPIVGEKRVKLAYTQVLPKEGDVFAYHYALQSELLKLHPLRQLAIEVHVSSAEPLIAVASPSHDCRIESSEHGARVSFDAQEYSPDRDFELRIKTKAPASDGGGVTFVEDYRGEDGYFLVRFSAPVAGAPGADHASEGARSEPRDWLILADTSGSTNGPARETQLSFIEALLQSLGEKDTFQVATCDVETRFAFPQSVPNDEASRAAALEFLEKRDALGWSDLAAAFGTAFDAAHLNTEIVYVGDGQPTLGDADPGTFARELPQLFAAKGGRGSVHAVVPGTTSEPLVLKALSRLGHGSLRSIGGGTDPTQTAEALVLEVTSPRVSDVRLSFDGLSVAAVYPDELPNLPAGRQQIVVGRFDPNGGARGRVKVSGKLGGKAVSYETSVLLDDRGEKQSFVPRLWARQHLDHLLGLGATPSIRERIIALSEEFQIATPYTSFLVLESEADRERFQVQKRLRMRDGEEFFAKGREDAGFELLRDQMKKAGLWHRGLRDDVLAELATMARASTELLRPETGWLLDGAGYAYGNQRLKDQSWGGAAGGKKLRSPAGAYRGPSEGKSRPADTVPGNEEESLVQLDHDGGDAQGADEVVESEDGDALDDFEEPSLDPAEPAASPAPVTEKEERFDKVAAKRAVLRDEADAYGLVGGRRARYGEAQEASLSQLALDARGNVPGRIAGQPVDELDALFPSLPPPAPQPELPKWSDEVLALLRALDRRALLAEQDGGMRFTSGGQIVDRRERVRRIGRAQWLRGRSEWLHVTGHRSGEGFEVHWLRGDERGAWRADWDLGRVRAREPGDERAFGSPIPWLFGEEPSSYRDWAATVRDLGDGRSELRLVPPGNPEYAIVVEIDRARNVVLATRTHLKEALQTSSTYGGFVEAAGAWWPTTLAHRDASGRVTSTMSFEVESLDRAAFEARLAAALAPRADVLELRKPPVDLAAAKQAVADGKGTLEDHWLILRAALVRGEPDQAAAPLAAIRALAEGKRGLERIELAVLARARRHEELRQRLLADARSLAATPREAELQVAYDLIGLGNSFAAPHERLELLLALEPVFRRQAEIPEAAFQFDQMRVGALSNAGRIDETFAAQEQLARDWPAEISAQLAFANALAQRGEVDRALAFLDRAEREHGPWEEHELEQLFSTRISIYWNGYRLEELVAAVETRLRERPDRANAWQLDQYLSAIVMLDREPQWWTTIERWLGDARAKVSDRGRLGDVERARVEAAVRQAIGQGYSCWWHDRRFDLREAEFLTSVARALLESEHDWHFAQQILTHHSFRQTLAARGLFAELYAAVESGAATLAADVLVRRIHVLRGADFRTDAGEPGWQAIFDVLLRRVVASGDAKERAALEALLLTYGRRELQLEVMRHRLVVAQGDDERGRAALALLTFLLQDRWTADFEDECLRLLPIVRGPIVVPLPRPEEDGAAAREARLLADDLLLRTRIVAWYDFVNWAIARRAEAAVAALPDVNLMPRRKLAAAREEQTKLARKAVRELLTRTISQGLPPGPVEWLKLDRAWLSVLLREELDATRLELLTQLRDVLEATNGRAPEEVFVRERVLATRCVTTLLHLLTKVPGETRDAHERELVAITDLAQAAMEPESWLLDWREHDFDRLVALDRGDALEAQLAEWFAGGDDFTKLRFGRTLAWVLAERGKLEQAVAVLEQIAKIAGGSELAREDWLALADWYTALDRKDDRDRARLAAWTALDEHSLSQLVHQASNAARDRGDGMPADVDPVVADQLVALMRKAQWPANYLWQLHHLYGRTKDFRLLQCLPEAVIGHSAQGVYPFLTQLWGIQGLVDEEATVDRVAAHLDAVMERAQTPVDHRALHLLRFMTQWKAAAQQNGGGPHADAALVAMKAAFDHPLAEGEARHLAGFLMQLGALAEPRLRAEQLRQLGELVRRAEPGSEDRLALAGVLANVQWQAGLREEALRTLGGELAARRGACGGRLPDSANDVLVQYGNLLQTAGEHATFEKLLLAELGVAANPQRTYWLENHLHQLWVTALGANAHVSLGRGRAIYEPALQAIRAKALARTNESQAGQYVQHLASLWATAHRLKVARVAEDATRFAFEDLPKVLANYQYRNGQSMVSTVGASLRDVAGPRDALEFLVTRAENEPRWLLRVNQTFWDQHAWSTARWRFEAKRLELQLERRLLALTTTELRAEMRHGRGRARGLYDRRWDTFWREKQRAFFDAAMAELEAGPDDEAVALRVADYLFRGLDQFDDAIEVLARRLREGRLSLDGQHALCRYLEERKRFAEELPILARLIEARPEQLDLRVMQMRALHGTRQRAALIAARAATEDLWRERKLWNEGVIAQLAQISLETELYAEAAAHFFEAIELHVKSAPNRGIGDGVLSHYYGQRAQALVALGRTSDAVDAAAGAIVSWGPRDDQRRHAIAALEQVLLRAESLEAYVEQFEAEVAASGLENPIVRKALGKVYRQQGQWVKAAAQLRAAVEAAPNDLELHDLLVETFDRANRPELAIEQLVASLEATGHDVARMRDLGRRLVRVGATARAERVHTNLVEMLPHESESHQALAEIREEQRRFLDAAEQWRQVIRIRSKEPTGYLGLAKALLAAGERDAAKAPLETLIGGTWEERFGDVKAEALALLRRAY